MNLLVRILAHIGYRWGARQESAFLSSGKHLSEGEIAKFQSYFSEGVLQKTKKIFLDQVFPKDRLSQWRLFFLRLIFRKQNLAGLTLGYAVFLKEKFTDIPQQDAENILFHELIHVTQYDVLGMREFMRRYFQSWKDNKFNYFNISLERVAYGLTHHYATFPDKTFSAKEKVIQGFEIK